MEHTLQLFLFFISLIFLFSIIRRSRNNSKSKGNEAPEPAGAWPIIGHLHLLRGDNKLIYRTLGDMADKYGPAFNIRLGTRRAFIVNDWKVAQECFTDKDKALSSRRKTTAAKLMGYNYAVFGFAPYSPFWREMRKITTMEILSVRRLEMMKDFRSSEINSGIKELYGRWSENSQKPVAVELDKWVEDVLFNVIVMMVAGKRYFGVGDNGQDGARCKKALGEFFRLAGIFVVSDAIPSLSWLDFQGHENEMKQTAKDLDWMLGGWLDEHRKKRTLGLTRNEAEEKDFIDVMLSLEEQGQLSNFEHDADTSIKSTCLALLLGATETTVETLIWTLCLLLNHPEALKKLQQEVDLHIGKDREVDESDLQNLVFLQAVMKETFRLYPAAPLVLREALEDCTVAGYNVKAGTQVMVNVWKLQRDSTVWADATDFKPERFMSPKHEHVDVKGQQFVLVPFGLGRRSCPGIAFGLQMLYLTLARLVHAFELSTPGGQPVDMTVGPGLSIPKKTPLEVVLTPRLPSRIYGC